MKLTSWFHGKPSDEQLLLDSIEERQRLERENERARLVVEQMKLELDLLRIQAKKQ